MDLRRDLIRSIKRNDIKLVREVFTELQNYPDSGNVKNLLLTEAITNYEIANFLADLPKFIDSEDDINLESYLFIAIRSGNVKLAELSLKNGAKLVGSEWGGYSMLQRSLFNPIKISTRKEILMLLIQHGMNTRVKNGRNENLLHQFIKYSVLKNDHDAVEVAQVLINSGVPVDDVEAKGFSPLLLSTYCENVSLVEFLIEQGADVNRKCKEEGLFPLFLATQCGNEELVKLLISAGANVNAKTYNGNTAVHRACIYHHNRILNLLIRYGADVCARDKMDKTSYSLLSIGRNNYEECTIVMVKELARLTFENITVLKSDMDAILEKPMAKQHFEKCTRELSLMASKQFYSPYSFYSVLKMTKNIKKLANLVKNEEFVKKFYENSPKFNYYGKDLQNIFDDAVRIKDIMQDVYLKIHSKFGKFLPNVVIRKIAENSNLKDLSLL